MTTADGDLLRASYGVMDGNYSLPQDLIHFDGLRPIVRPVTVARTLVGPHYFVGNVHRHFGHVLLEGLSRMWALSQVDKSEFRFLFYEEPRPFALALFARLGITPDQIEVASTHDLVRELFVPDVAMRTHRWITPEMGAVWRSMRDDVEPYRKIYLSRTAIMERRLLNEDEIERYFESRGYEVVSPQKMTVDEQLRLASESSHLAGAVGSQMYLAAFMAPGGSVSVVAPNNFYLKDDVLVSSAVDLNLDVEFGTEIDYQKPKAARDWRIDMDLVRPESCRFSALRWRRECRRREGWAGWSR